MAEVTRREHALREILGWLAVGVVTTGGTYLVALWPWIGNQFEKLGEPVTVSRGWLLLLIGNFVFTLIALALIILAKLSTPEFAAYREDRFFGLIWRWSWSGSDPKNIWCWCPHCDRMMACQNNPPTMEKNRTSTFFCHACQVPYERVGSRDQTINEVSREIDLKVRNGTWKAVVESQKK